MNNENRDPTSNSQQSNTALPLLTSFYQAQIIDLNQVIRNMQKVEDELKDKHDQCENYLNQIAHKRRENDKFGNISKGVLNAKSEQIKSKAKNIQSVSSGIKQVVAKIKVANLSKLPVNKQRSLNKLFKTLYETLYSQKTQYKWQQFNKLALKHEQGQDFISRLVNINFKQLPSQKYDKLMELKNDPQFQNIATKSQHNTDIIDLTDWVDYVCLGCQFSNDKKRAEKQYDKIRKDVDKKMKGSLQVSENFWKQASQEIDGYQSEVRNICSELLAMQFQMKRSLQKAGQQPLKTPSNVQTDAQNTKKIRG